MFQMSDKTKSLAVSTLKEGAEKAVALAELGFYTEAAQLFAAQLLICSSLTGGAPRVIAKKAHEMLMSEIETMMAVMSRPTSLLDSLMDALSIPEDVRAGLLAGVQEMERGERKETVKENASRMGISLEDEEK